MRRIPQLDGLRGVAILMVFATHAFRIPILWVGVDLFFVLSGYLITRILLRLKDQRSEGYWGKFYIRRAQRILPPYALLLLGMALLGVPWLHFWYWYVLFCANVGMAFHKIGLVALAPLWSLAVEEQFYLLWPCIVLACSHKNLSRLSACIIVSSPILRALFTPHFSDHFPIYCLTVFRADTLAMGAWIAVSEHVNTNFLERHGRTAFHMAIAAVTVFGLLSLAPNFRTGANSILFNTCGYSLSVLFFGGVLVHSLARSTGVSRGFLTLWPLQHLGRISYTFYLWHVAVFFAVHYYIHARILAAFVSFLVTCGIAYLSWILIESRILNLRGFSTVRLSKLPATA